MTVLTNKIINDALTLPTDLRAELVDKLVESLNIPTQKQIDALWAKEAEKRLKSVRSGKVKPVSGEKIFSDIRKKYGKKHAL